MNPIGPSEPLTVLVHPDVKRKARAKAAKNSISISILIRQWLSAYIQVEDPTVRYERLMMEMKALARELDKKK